VRRGPQKRGFGADPVGWVWGRHAAEAALKNPLREEIEKVVATEAHAAFVRGLRPDLTLEVRQNAEIAQLLPGGAVHQGIAVKTPPLEGVELEALGVPAEGVLLMLDQVTDPQNVGAIFRSAAALGARGLILQDRHAPALGGALAKAAAGAVDTLPTARVVNLSRALDRLSDLGWTVIGLAGEATTSLDTALGAEAVVIVLGSEGEGMRRLVTEHCDDVAAIPMPGGFESLNVSAAAAIALYEAGRQRRGKGA
jgi:23S rRNA (guanosine2251-2'-O)-methyltransferase